MAFQNGDGERQRNVQQELKKTRRQAKEEYKKKVERQLENNNTKQVWRVMRTITGYRLKNSQSVEGDDDRANTFNQYFNRFDSVAFFTSAAAPSTPPLHLLPLYCFH